jgi:histidine triad (HIT) family protein
VIPRRHIVTLPDLPDALMQPLFSNARLIASVMGPALGADGSFVGINSRVSQSVPHLHVHVLPRSFGDGLRGFFWPRRKYESEDQAEQVRSALHRAVTEKLREPADKPGLDAGGL